MDASILEHVKMGKIRITKHEIDTISKIDKVLLFTYDTNDFSGLFSNTKHIPHGFGSSLFFRKITAPITGFFALLRHHKDFRLMRFFGVACPHAALIKKLLKSKYLIVSFHYEWAKQACLLTRNRILCAIAYLAEKFVLSQADIVIALTPALAEKAKKRGAKRVIIIPNCIPQKLIRKIDNISKEDCRNKLGIPRDKIVILFVGRLVKIKNVSFIIKGFERIARERNDVILYIVGDGPEREKLKKEAKHLINSNKVVFTGFQPIEKVYLFMKAADIFVNASLSEGHPRAVIEALASGTPVVASRVIGNKDVIIHGINGLLFEVNDIDDFVLQLKKIINDEKLRRKLSKTAKNLARKKYDCEKVDKKQLIVLKYFATH